MQHACKHAIAKCAPCAAGSRRLTTMAAAVPGGMQQPKSHKAALAVALPYASWGPIQATRVRWDKSFCRWPPHINLL